MPRHAAVTSRRRSVSTWRAPSIRQIVTSILPIAVVTLPVTPIAAQPTTRDSGTKIIAPLNGTEKVTETYGRRDSRRFLTTATGAGDSVDGKGALHLGATSATADGSKYYGVMIALPEPVDLTTRRLLFDARTNHPGATAALYVRAYNRGERKPAWSVNSWNAQLAQSWRQFSIQSDQSLSGLAWEANVVEDRVATAVDRLEFIIGTREDDVPIDILLDNIRTGIRLASLQDLDAPHPRTVETVLVQDATAAVTVLHPDSAGGRAAAAIVTASIASRTGVRPATRVGTEADRVPDEPVILLGNVNSNPAMLLLYARYLTPADSVCPGAGGTLVHSVCDPFGHGANVIVAAASDDAGLARAAEVLAHAISQQPKSKTLILPRLFEKHYGDSFLKRYRWAGDNPAEDRLERGLRQGQDALDRGTHRSIAGVLESVGQRYALTGHSVEAELFVGLWDLYAASAQADPRKYGGPWGFDSDFAAAQTVAFWDLIEDDPVLSDAQRLRTTRNLGRWLSEAVIPKCSGAATSTHVPHNHQTFPGLGALFAGLYYSQHYDLLEGRAWLEIADAMFQRQAGYYKPLEDCNGYQWLTNGHLMRYCLARPSWTLFQNGNGSRIIDYCIGTMDNLGYQVPYGDTGSWQCWNSEMVCLDMYAFATGSPEARWAANRKRSLKNTVETHAFYQLEPGERPDRFNGVTIWPLEPQYYETLSAANRPPLTKCVDKIAFREDLDPAAAYLLLDGLSNGGHKHLDGNSLPRLTLFDRIWLADNDYYKAPAKYHNTVTVFQDGKSSAIPPYVELIAAGESSRFGCSKTRLSDYAGVDWDRTVVWLKEQQAFVVLDQLTARSDDEYQFRALWHGVGDATLDEHGLLLTQQGPSLRIQIAPGPRLQMQDDAELGANWRGYPHAEPVVHSLQGVATVRLKQGESYLLAGMLHGEPNGVARHWVMEFLADADGVKISRDGESFGIVLRPGQEAAPQVPVKSDAECLVLSDTGVSLLGASHAQVDGKDLFRLSKADYVDVESHEAAAWLAQARRREPIPNIDRVANAPLHPAQWHTTPASQSVVDDSEKSAPHRFSRLANASLVAAGPSDTILAATTAGRLFALNTDGSTRWTLDTGTRLNDVVAADLTGDGKDEIVLARQDYHVQVIDAAGKELWTRALTYYRKPPTVNLVRTGDIDGDGRLEVIAGGENWRFYAFRSDGTELWNYESVHPSRAGAVADLDGDGKDEVICGTHYYWASVLNYDGTARWKYRFGPICYDIATGHFGDNGKQGIVFGGGDGMVHYVDANGKQRMAYDTGDDVQHVEAADVDGNGVDEILAGSQNYNVYCFGADAKRRWRLDMGAPISALTTVSQSPGRLTIAGTAEGRLASIDAAGAICAVTDLDCEITELLIHRGSIIVATADGQIRSFTVKNANPAD